MTGYSKREVLHKDCPIYIGRTSRHKVLLALQIRDLKAGEEVNIIHKNGQIIPVLLTLSNVNDSITFFFKDIRGQKQMEEERISYLEKIEARNKELARFSYITSHDLKRPIRSISMISHFIGESLDKQNIEEARSLFLKLKNVIFQLHHLLEDILKYTSVGTKHEPVLHCDAGQQVLKIIDEIEDKKNIHFAIEPDLPVFETQAGWLYEVWENLIQNAVQYMDKNDGKISIGMKEEKEQNHDGHYIFYVEDNGPGIEKKYHEKIFDIFQSLQTRENNGNTGLGLALVRKIIREKEGKVWLESQPGTGSTFFFTWPKK